VIARAFDCFDGGGFACFTAALCHVKCFVGFFGASVDEDFDVFSPDVFFLNF
jgi:hypothetical protein